MCVNVGIHLIFLINNSYVTELCSSDSFAICGRVFLHTTEILCLWPLTSWQPWGPCLSDPTCSNWPANHPTRCLSSSRDPFFTSRSPELILLCVSGISLLWLGIIKKRGFTVNSCVFVAFLLQPNTLLSEKTHANRQNTIRL